MNFKNMAVRFREREGFVYIFLVLYALILLLWYSYTTSPLYNRIGFDSAIFKIIGIGILEGKVPYRDLFDHKGPVIFFINALGQLISPGRAGLFLLQTVSLSCAFVLIYKISRLFSSVKKSAAIALLIGLFMTALGVGGNQVEEWELPWQLLSVYLDLRNLLRHCIVYAVERRRADCRHDDRFCGISDSQKTAEAASIEHCFISVGMGSDCRSNSALFRAQRCAFGIFLRLVHPQFFVRGGSIFAEKCADSHCTAGSSVCGSFL